MSRDFKERPIEDLQASNAFRDTLVPRADGSRGGGPLWHGWAIMDAFLAGLDHRDAEIERLRTALKEIQVYSVGDPRPRHTWYYDRAESALNQQITP